MRPLKKHFYFWLVSGHFSSFLFHSVIQWVLPSSILRSEYSLWGQIWVQKNNHAYFFLRSPDHSISEQSLCNTYSLQISHKILLITGSLIMAQCWLIFFLVKEITWNEQLYIIVTLLTFVYEFCPVWCFSFLQFIYLLKWRLIMLTAF